MTWRADANEGNETGKVCNRIAPFISGHGLDLGCGMWPLPVQKTAENSCLGVDGGYAPWGTQGAQFIADVKQLPMFSNESFDYVYSSHTLEDMPVPEAVLSEWWRLIKVGGYLILYLPLAKDVARTLGRVDWENFYPNKGEPLANPAHEHDYSPQEIEEMIGRTGDAEKVVDEIRGDFDEYSFLQVYKKLSSTSLARPSIRVHEQRRALVVRYGAIGDVIQSVPVLRKLKADGYRVTFNCSAIAKEILENCPYVDEFAIQIKDYVPNFGNNLDVYWDEIKQGYDKFVNLTGAAEGSLLIPDRDFYRWTGDIRAKNPGIDETVVLATAFKAARGMAGSTNYYDKHLELAGYKEDSPRGELFFSRYEELMAQAFRERHKGKFIVLWALAGSSYHKLYPYFHTVAQELLVRNPDILLITTGDAAAKLLERAPSAKYLPRAGEWTLRTSMLMTKYVDLVIGPETGMLNAAGCFSTPKITFLSHSSHDNFCKYFENDYCLAPIDTFCHPCHVLHYTHTHGPSECGACDHNVHPTPKPEEIKKKGVTGGFWSCPYSEAGPEAGANYDMNFPLCTTKGMPPRRVLARIQEVYARWQAEQMNNR